MTTPKLGLTELVEGQASAEITVNGNLALMDFLVGSIVSSELNDPPVEPAEGTIHLVGSSPTGDWVGHSGEIAAYYSGWKYFDPPTGWRIYNAATGKFYVVYGGSLREVMTANSADVFKAEKPVEIAEKLKFATATNLTASISQDQTGLILDLAKQVHVVSTVANTDDSVVLPASIAAGHTLLVANHGSNTLQVWPSVDHAIGNLDLNIPVALTAGKSVQFIAVGESKWLVLAGA